MTVYNAFGTPPPGTMQRYSDNRAIILGNLFHLQSGGNIDASKAYVTGGRLWTPNYIEGITSSIHVDIRLYLVPEGEFVNPIANRTAVRSKVATVNPGGWTEAIFDDPWKIQGYNLPWCIAYTFVEDPEYYYANLTGRPSDGINYADNPANGLFYSGTTNVNPGVLAWGSGYYHYYIIDAGDRSTNPTITYGMDTIVSDNLSAASEQWSIWNGTAEVPASAKLWNGTSEVPVTTTVN